MSWNAFAISMTNSFSGLLIDDPLDPAETTTKIVKTNTKNKRTQRNKSKSYSTDIFETTPQKQNGEKTTKKVNKARITKSVKPAIDPTVSLIQTKPKIKNRAKTEAQQRLRKPPSYNLRKLGDGEDQAQWTKLVPLNKSKKIGEVSLESKGARRDSDTSILLPVRHMSDRAVQRRAATVRRRIAVVQEAIDAFERASFSFDQPSPQCEDEKEFPSLT